MSLKLRLALLFSLSVFIILLVSALSIFILNENFRRDEFIKRLVLEGSESFELFFSVPVPTQDIIDDLNKNAANSLPDEKIIIFDSVYHVLYPAQIATIPHIEKGLFKLAREKQDYNYTYSERECVLLSRNLRQKQYYVFASANDIFGIRKSENLKIILIFSVIGGLLLSGFLAFFYVKQAINPLEKLKKQIEKIDEKNLKERIPVGNRDNEVWQIAKKFNAMLERLEQAFEQRKSFVQHASHELRTPLANMLSQTEAALSKKMSEDEYRKILISLQEDQQDMIELTNSLLALSRYEKITSAEDLSAVRIDEVLYETADFAKQIRKDATVTIQFETVPANEEELVFIGNESLIKSAINNLIKNGIAYSSDNLVKVSILANKNGITLHFDNRGKQLSVQEQSNLFIPFFRGENSFSKKGFGLGLSIVQRIINVHNGTIQYEARENSTNRFSIFLPTNRS